MHTSKSFFNSTPQQKENEYKSLLESLYREKILPLKGPAKDEGIYVHKSKVGYKSSLLISPNEKEIYELIHHPISERKEAGKKIILGKGFETVVREGVNIKTGMHVAIKIYPLYKKKFSPLVFSKDDVNKELFHWKLSQKVNTIFPNTFVKLHDYFFAGDKGSTKNPKNKILYIITQKYNYTLSSIMKDEKVNLNEIKKILIKVFAMHRKLISKGYICLDNNPGNILLDENKNPIFCDPSELIKLTSKSNFSRFADTSFSMLRVFFGSRIPLGNREKFDKICDHLKNFLATFAKKEISDDYIKETFEELFCQITKMPSVENKLDFIKNTAEEDRNEVEANPEKYGYRKLNNAS